MQKNRPIFYSALLLTAVNLLLRFAGTSFQVYISNRIGAAGVGLLQLILSVGSFAMIAGMGGIRTATMYLAAEEFGKKRAYNIPCVLSGCFIYSIICSSTAAGCLYILSPYLAEHWIGDIHTVSALRLYAAFLPVTCLCGVMTGLFTAANRIGTLASVEIVEQILSMGITIMLLGSWAGHNAVKACQSVIFGSCCGGCMTLVCLVYLQRKEHSWADNQIPVRSRLMQAAIPLALADMVKAGINTTENLMVPNRLKNNILVTDPLAAFGMVTGMVFPVIMFPACILFGLAELIIPEMARCAAANRQIRIQYLVKRSLKITMIYGIFFGGLIFLLAEDLCILLYRENTAANFMKAYALLIPMLYCDAITDAITKGLGQQKICVRYNIITSAMDVILLYILLPRHGMQGYWFSFMLTHLINFILSFRRMLKISGVTVPLSVPLLSMLSGAASVFLAELIQGTIGKIIAYLLLTGSLLCIFQIIHCEDVLWILHLCIPTNHQKRKAGCT